MTRPKQIKAPALKDFFKTPAFSYCLYALLAFLAFSPCLLGGQAYFDNDLLAQFGPWRAFLKDQLAQGHFPLWNPYSLGGQPFFADLQNMMLYPFNYLTLPFSLPMGLSIFFFIHMFWAALGMHLWLKTLGLSENSSRIGALLFSFSGFFWLELIHPPVLAAFAWLPWLFVRLELWAISPKPRNAFITGFCFAMLFLCGSFQVTVGAFYGGLAYFLFRVFQERKIKSVSLMTFKPALVMGFFLLWGALPLLGQMIPTMEFSSLSSRNTPDAQTVKLNQQLSLNPATLLQFFFPRMALKPDQDMAEALQSDKNASAFSFAANWGYLGPWVLPFFFLAFGRKEKGTLWFWGTFAVFSLFYCFGCHLPLYGLLSRLLPGLSIIRVPYRFLYLYVLAVCVLTAFGFEQWQNRDHQDLKSKPQPFRLLAYALPLILICFLHFDNQWRELAGLVLGLGALFLGSFQKPWSRTAAPAVYISAFWIPLLLNGWADFQPGPASNFNYEINSKAVLQAADSIKPHRVLFLNQDMYYPIQVGGQKYLLNYPQNAACALNIKNFGGYNPLMLQSKAEIGTLPLKPLIQLGAIQGLLTQKSLNSIPDFKPVSFPPYFLNEYQKPLPYAYAPQNLVTESNSARRLALLQNPDFDAAQTALLSIPYPKEWNSIAPANLQCRLEKDGVDNQTFFITLDRPNLVVFCEVMYPGWRAFIDGQSAPLYTADHFLRTIYAPAGQHQVEFQFDPDWWLPIRIGLAIWLLVTLTGLLFFTRLNQGTPFA